MDFTIVGYNADDKDPRKIKEAIQSVLSILAVESGITYSIYSFHPNEGHTISSVQFRGPLNHPNRIKLDISLSEKMALAPESRIVKSDYPDLLDYTILSYSLKEILAEKIRSIMQRGYSRDYYDVWRLMKEQEFDEQEIKTLVVEKCDLKGIKFMPDLLFDRVRIAEAKDHWTSSLAHLVRDLPEADNVILDLRNTLAFLQEH
ncbi:MAG: nucleotidyl transferase AbiEii/AbiGii toxin family protein [Nitrososphaera sp.]